MTYFKDLFNKAIEDIKLAIQDSQYEIVRFSEDDNNTVILINTNKEEPVNQLILNIPKTFPYANCEIYATDKNRDLVVGLPGVNDHLQICAINYSISRPNPDKPAEFIINLIERAIKRIEDGLNGVSEEDYKDEFFSYWLCQSSNKYFHFIADNINDSTILKAKEKIKDKYYIVNTSINDDEIGNYKNVIYFKTEKPLISPNQKINIQEILTDFQLRQFSKSKESIYFVLIEFINEDILIGFDIDKKNAYILKSVSFNNYKKLNEIFNKSKKLHIEILNTEKYYGRAGQGKSTITNNPVIIIGGGSIGSNLANYLQFAGVTNFIVIDPQTLNFENLGRHTGYFDQVIYKKAEIIQQNLYKKFPLTKCQAIHNNYIKEMQDNEKMFLDSDLIIDTTGDATSHIGLLRWLKHSEYNKNIVLCGVEPFMTMGHVVVANNQNADYIINRYDNNYLYKLRFLYKPLSKKEAGCVPYYFEYGGLDFIEYTMQAARLITAVLNKKISEGIFVKTGNISEKFIKEKQLILNDMTRTYIDYYNLKSYYTYKFNEKEAYWEEYDIYI